MNLSPLTCLLDAPSCVKLGRLLEPKGCPTVDTQGNIHATTKVIAKSVVARSSVAIAECDHTRG